GLTVSGIPPTPPPAAAVSVHAPNDKPAVGLESVEAKDSRLPPVEDVTDAERAQQADVIVKLSGDAERERRQRRQDPAEDDPDAPAEEPLVLAGARPDQQRHLAEFDAPPAAPGTLLDQTI